MQGTTIQKSPVSVPFLKIMLPNTGPSLVVMTVLQTSIRFDQLHIIYCSSATFWELDKSKRCYRIEQEWPYIPLTL